MGDSTIRKCTRCGSTLHIESHHKKPKYKGGKDTKRNREDLCKGCHDFKHTEINIQDAIRRHKKRLKLLQYRLKVLRQLNTPTKILEKGYTSYWVDQKTHGDYK